VAKNTLTKCKKGVIKLKRFAQKNWIFEEKRLKQRWHVFCLIILQRIMKARVAAAAAGRV